MARYRIQEADASISIEVTEVGGHENELMQAFGECQAGRCSCPTEEYAKLASMEVQERPDGISLRLEAKEGTKLNASEIAACLDYTTELLTEETPSDPSAG